MPTSTLDTTLRILAGERCRVCDNGTYKWRTFDVWEPCEHCAGTGWYVSG